MVSLRTVLVNDHARFASALERYLARRTQVEVVGKIRSCSPATQSMSLHPDLVLIAMPFTDSDVFDLIRQLKAQPNPPYVVLLIPDDIDEYRSRARTAGADGCALQTELESQLLPLVDKFSHEM